MGKRRRLVGKGVKNLIKGGQLPSEISHTRGSSGTYYDSNGYVATASANVLRVNYLRDGSGDYGILMEDARANVLLESEDLSDSNWLGGTQSSDTITLPTGVSGAAYYLTAAEIYQFFNGGAVEDIALSFFSKKRTSDNFIEIEVFQQTSGTVATLGAVEFQYTGLNPDTTYFKNIKREELPNGWYRFKCEIENNSGLGTGTFHSSARVDVETDNYIWGTQIELVAGGASSYIKTSGATVTRSADLLSKANLDTTPWFNPLEGTFVAEWKRDFDVAAGKVSMVLALNDGSSTDRIELRQDAAAGSRAATGNATTGSVDVATVTGSTGNANIKCRAAFSYKTTNYGISVNGDTAITSSSGTLTTAIDNLEIGGVAFSSGNTLNGTLLELYYLPSEASDAQLPVLSARNITSISDLEELDVWLDADDATTISETSNLVDVWSGQGDTIYSATQSTGSKQFVVTANSQNGRTGLDVDQVDDIMAISGYTPDWNNIDFTVFAVAKTVDSTDTFRGIISNRPGSSNWWTLGREDSTNDTSVEYGPASGVAYGRTGVEPIGAGAQIFMFRKFGTSGEIYLDNVLKDTDDISGRNLGGAANSLTIGTWLADGQNLGGLIYEIAVYRRALTIGEATEAHGLLSEKWGT